MVFRDDFNFEANPIGIAISQQRDDKLFADEDSTMDDVSEKGSTIGLSANSSLQVDTQQVNLANETPRGSRWGLGSLYMSARSLTRRLVFSPLAPVSESPESSSQTTTTSAPQAVMVAPEAVTESSAPTLPKKKSSTPSSGKDRRAKSRRHDSLAVKSTNTVTTSTNQGSQRSRAKQADPTSGDIEAMEAMSGTHPGIGEEEAR